MCPTETLSKICLGRFEGRRWIPGLAAGIPYRSFYSGTQLRTDGKELLLEACIGPVVASKSFREGVDEGFLARPRFFMINVESATKPETDDPMELTRRHMFRDGNVAKAVANVANNLLANGFSVLFLLGELSQFPPLLGNLRYPVALAHGGSKGVEPLRDEDPVRQKSKKKTPSDVIPKEYLDMEVETEVARFNARESRCLAGTSCISVGTDIKPRGPTAVFYLMAMTSEIMFRQAVGRGSRREGKEEFYLFDVRVTNVEVLRRHADERARLCEQMYERTQDL
jgi:superfamily II DNA or RNA helicase